MALVLLSLFSVGILVERRIAEAALDEMRASLEAQAVLVRELSLSSLQHGPDPEFQSKIVALGDAISTRLTVITAAGAVIADSDDDPASMDNHILRPEIVAAVSDGSGFATRFSRTVAANMMYHASAIRIDGELIGFARTSLPLTEINDQLSEIRTIVTLGAAFATLIALIVGLLVAGRITAPLIGMTSAVESIADGDYGKRVNSSAGDEIGLLGKAFNRMAGELEDRMRTITADRNVLLTILAGMAEGLIAVDGEERIVHLNPAAGRLFGVDPEKCTGKKLWEVIRGNHIVEMLRRSFQNRSAARSRFSIFEEIDGGREVELHAAPLEDIAGNFKGAVFVFDDVTELRRLETVRQDFVANVSHELKTPIAAIRGLVETILDDREMPGETRDEFLNRVQNQSVRLSLIVTDLLTLARLDSAEAVFEAETVDLRDRVTLAGSHFRAAADGAGIDLVVEVPVHAVNVSGDLESLDVVINNLVDNALKYTPKGGRVSISLEADENETALVVKDTGVGIAAEHRDRIFERFYRIDKARSRELGGTGLGLSIVKHVVKVHGGEVLLESEPGSGSSFRVILPLA